MSDYKKVQLFKLSKELGVTTERLIQHLGDTSHADALIGQGLNAKVGTEEAYFALLEEFSKDKAHVATLRAKKAQADADAGRRAQDAAAAVARAESEAAERADEERRRRDEDERMEREETAARVKAEKEAAERATAEAAARAEAAAEAAKATAATATPPAVLSATDAVSPTVRAAAAAAAAAALAEREAPSVIAPENAAPEGDENGVIRADQTKLRGLTVLKTIDLAQFNRSGKRPRKGTEAARSADPATAVRDALRPDKTAAAKTTTTTAAATTGAGGRKKDVGKKRKGGPVVDEAEVESTMLENLRQMQQGTGTKKRQNARRDRRAERADQRAAAEEAERVDAGTLRVTEFLTTGELANLMDVHVTEVIGKLFASGVMASINQRLDADTIQIVAADFGFEIEFISEFEEGEVVEEIEDDPASLLPRPPVVTVMGHVDHGKTSLLDYIRSANVVSGEAGGITQHIGAYAVPVGDRAVTFLDTPGHEAFTAMRARGAQATDIVILVVAADDSVMPQTIEAINHAKAAGVPMVVAINKMDKPEANALRVKQQLSEHGVLVEEFGGKVQNALVSAKKGTGVDDLLEKVLLEADQLELKANPNRNAVGLVIESRLDKGRGTVSTILVQAGTLRVGDSFVVGSHSGRVRAMFDEHDERIEEVGPGMPAAVLGIQGAPEVGDRLNVMDEREARAVALRRTQIHREQAMRQRKHITLDEIGRRLAVGDFRQLNLIVKADVGGSVEALSDSLLKLTTPEVAVQIIHSGVGAITESDVMLATASEAIVIAFNVRPTSGARLMAEREEIDIRAYSIIYDAIQDVRDALEGLLSPEQSEKTLGVAEVRETFRVPKAGVIAGCFISEGKLRRSDKVRLIRDGVVVLQSASIGSMKRFKDDVREVLQGYECGLSLDGFNDVKIGDQIEAFEIVETKRRLEPARA